MRVGLVITRGDEFGGAQLHVSYIAKYLTKKGYHVEVITGTTGVFTDYLHQQGISTTRVARLSRSVNFVNDLIAVWTLVQVFGRGHFNLVAAHSSKAGLVAALSARLTGTPVVFTAHSWPFLQGLSTLANWGYRALSYLTCRLVDHVICVCIHDFELVRRSNFIQEGKFSVIHNGIPDLATIQRCRHPVNKTTVCSLVMVARLAHPKDPTLLLRAMPKLEKTRLTLVGDGPERSTLEALCQDLKINERVTFVGESSTPEVFIAQADIVLLITQSEGLPLAILEGFRAGKPVIGTAVGGIPEAINDGNQGYLVEPGNLSDLVSKLQILVTDQDLRHQMGKRARRTYESYFLDQKMLTKTHDVYQEVLQRHQRG